MSQGCGRERWFGTETRKTRTAEAFAESYRCSDSSEVAWEVIIPLEKEHSCSYRRNPSLFLAAVPTRVFAAAGERGEERRCLESLGTSR